MLQKKFQNQETTIFYTERGAFFDTHFSFRYEIFANNGEEWLSSCI